MPRTLVQKQRGEAIVGYLVALAVVGLLGLFVVKPKLIDAESRRAAAAQKASSNLDSSIKAQSAAAAGGVAAIGQVNAQAPESPQKQAIAREVPAVLSKMEPPDLKAQNEALERMNAVMRGQLELADRLYKSEAELTRAQAAEIAKSKEELKNAHLAISEAAAANLAQGRIIAYAAVIIVLLVAGIAYLKLFGISRGTVGSIIADIRSGTPPTVAFDTHLAPWHHRAVQKAARLATPSE